MTRYCRFAVCFAAAGLVIAPVSNRVFAAEPTQAQIEEAKKQIDRDPEQARQNIMANPELLNRMSPAQRDEVMQYLQAAEQKKKQAPAARPTDTATQAPSFMAPATAAPAPPQPGTMMTPAVKKTEWEWVRNVYGRELFREEFLNPQYVAIPDDYVIAPGDEILLRFWGNFNQERKYLIGDDGYVFIDPLKRQAFLIGMTLGGLKAMVQRVSEASPGVEGDVRIVGAHPIYAHIAGNALHPGTVSAPAYFTFWQFLMLSKGPSDNGSVRDIRVSRKGKEIARIDLYDFLRSGRKPIFSLQNEDLIFFGDAKLIVKVDSLVKRPGLYEMKETERLGDLTAVAGGFASDNFAPRIQIRRTVDISEKSSSGFPYAVVDVDLSQKGWEKTELKDGDAVLSREMAPLFANDIYITGNGVTVPGRYSLPRRPWSAADLLREAGGPVIGAHRSAELMRLNPDGTRAVVPIDLFNDEKLRSLQLIPRDSLMTYHDSEFVEITMVRTRGFVRRPVEERYSDSLTLADVLRKSEGVRDGALPYVYIKRTDDFGRVSYLRFDIADSAAAAAVRLGRRDDVMFFDYKAFNKKMPVMVLVYGREPLALDYSPDLTFETVIHELGGISPLIDSSRVEVCVPDFRDEPTYAEIKTYPLNAQTSARRGIIPEGSIVFIRKDMKKDYGYFIDIEGEVRRPGRYPLLRRDARLSEIFDLAGGLTERANKWGISIVRLGKSDTIVRPAASDTVVYQEKSDTIVHPRKSDTLVSTGRYDTIVQSGRYDTIIRQKKCDTVINQGKNQTIPVEVRDREDLLFVNDWVLDQNDLIRVERNDYAVEVTGAVFYPHITAYHPGYHCRDYVKNSAGGALDTADVARTYVRYANGVAKKARTGWWIFSSVADVYPGSRIVVPYKPYLAPPKEVEKTDYSKPISMISATLLSVLSILLIANQLK
jgi:protein involved in polysaccharide export with SLBB domain